MSILKVKSGDEWVDVPALAGVQDVTLAGTSCVVDGVAKIPIAAQNSSGVVKPIYRLGFNTNTDGSLYVYNEQSYIDSRQNAPLDLRKLDYAVTAALTDGRGPAWTPAQQAAARARTGLGGDWALVEDITLSEATNLITRNTDPSGKAYMLKAVEVVIKGASAFSSSGLVSAYVAPNREQVFIGYTNASNQNHLAVIENGMFFSSFVAAAGDGGYGAVYQYMNSGRVVGKTHIEEVRIGVPMTAGTSVKIYGIWA